MRSRKQMTPGMQKCKDKYGKSSPYKAADANLVKGASKVAEGKMNAAVNQKTTTEQQTDIGQQQVNKYMGDDAIDFKNYGYTSNQQIQENNEAASV